MWTSAHETNRSYVNSVSELGNDSSAGWPGKAMPETGSHQESDNGAVHLHPNGWGASERHHYRRPGARQFLASDSGPVFYGIPTPSSTTHVYPMWG